MITVPADRGHRRRCPMCHGHRRHCPRCGGEGFLETRGYETARRCRSCSRVYNPPANPTVRQAVYCLFCRDREGPPRSAEWCLACGARILDVLPLGRPRLYCRSCSPARVAGGSANGAGRRPD